MSPNPMHPAFDQAVHTELVDERRPAADVGRVYVAFVSAYLVGEPGGPWVLVDTGLPHLSALLRRRAEQLHHGRPPEAIVLTHGHFDHAGNALDLSRRWDAPVYAHPLELPYLTGRSAYPPTDPTVGGALGLMSRAFPSGGTNLGRRIQALPDDGSVPGLEEWRWLHTPGHTAGHVSLWRERDRVLIAGDALATVDQGSPWSPLNLRACFAVPPAPLTTDWASARSSVEALAALRPRTVLAGHGAPVHGPRIADDLAQFAAEFTPPRGGRYSERPAIADLHGVVDMPPPVPDHLPRNTLMVVGLVAGGALLARRARAARVLRYPGPRE
jgi:glyoxylase-like metal-dependent hydrolase (beta-lactamase superfamily II)